ncbi:hypothetical protein CRM22_003552 [Opisthorchis felineus]|uniref:Protoheme IX farnesyltransferase, mitochondrial n=1 Tax=Opisthorchis felineus TaxID=147828 RepID=A0A4S2M0Q0_OPIFE|nr:hypothetical protein CRM22_003552 [Opisthorchis felineus]
MGFRHLPLFFLVSRSPHTPTLSKQPTRIILYGRHHSMGYSRRYSGSLQLETQSAVPSGSAEQAQSKRLGASISQIPFTPTSMPRSATDLYSTPDSRERMDTDLPITSSVCPILASPEQILVPTFPQSLNRSLEVAAGLSKARLSLLVVSTAVVGCVLAASTSLTSPLFLAHPYRTILCLIVGTGLTSAAANTINQIVEIPYDSQMMRTRDRVLVRGLTNPGRAGLFALGCAGTGLVTLCLGTNPLVVWLAAGNLLLYTTLYTPLKQFSQANTWIGALVGGVPPLMGWAAATGEIHSGSLILASLLYVWQFPHFMALSWNLRAEYSKAGYMMTSVLEPPVCKQVALRYAVACSLVCLAGAGCSAISLGPWAGCALGLTCLPPNIGLIYYAWQFSRADSQEGSAAAARRLFRSTLLHLPIVMTAALIGTYICGTTIGAGQ